VVLGGFRGITQFSFMESSFGVLFRWFWVVLRELGNIPLWGVDLGPCVGGFAGVRQFSFMGS
jgi:hypothetical protein